MGKKETRCTFGEKEEMRHIYYCEILRENRKVSADYEDIYKDNVIKQVKVYKLFEENFKTRDKIINERNIQSFKSIM